MKRVFCLCFPIAILAGHISAQQSGLPASYPVSANQLDTIAVRLEKISRSVDQLQMNWKDFFRAFSTDQGLRLTDRQQKLLLAFEVLNRAEQRLGNLQKMRMDSTQKQAELRLQLARVTDDLLPESIDRYVSTRGTLNTEQLRDIRRLSDKAAERDN